MGAISRQEVALALLKFLESSSWQPMSTFRLVCEQEVAMEVVSTNIDNNLLLGSGHGAPTYWPAVELSCTQFEIASGAQFENAVGPNRV
ncbi:hypothetical protein E2C01_037890 [Portunus trituberculatus]|uniref:Uncharacterized protein n=1 Tax=Portunus trituberculatus TaxID=210409 RepID=A0A5B7FGH6_PORTR|nr:hypothetical protein [Portunus trituberculatus]